jgi:hypothetical protein
VLQLESEQPDAKNDRRKSSGPSTEDNIANFACQVVAVESQLTIVSAINHNDELETEECQHGVKLEQTGRKDDAQQQATKHP